MQKWLKDKSRVYQKQEDKSLETIFSEEGGLFEFIRQHMIDFKDTDIRCWLVFSKEEEKMLDEIACKLYPTTEDRSYILVGGVLYKLKDHFLTPVFATYLTENAKDSLLETNSELLRLAIQIGRK
jgi:hypothetical protein